MTTTAAQKFEVHFEKGSIDLTENAMTTLLDLKELIKADGLVTKVKLSGFTDTLGRPEMNKQLAEQSINLQTARCVTATYKPSSRSKP